MHYLKIELEKLGILAKINDVEEFCVWTKTKKSTRKQQASVQCLKKYPPADAT